MFQTYNGVVGDFALHDDLVEEAAEGAKRTDTARLLWDDSALYVAVDFRDRDLVEKFTTHDTT